jgi:peptidoglycan/LPS O-acetylase OafA/YrhL
VTHGRIAGLDLIRGIAIAFVLVRHAWPDAGGIAGIVGVVVFFTLSGYLITGLLTADISRYGRVRYGRFYRNRALRLFPPMLLLLVVVAAVMLTWNPLGDGDLEGVARVFFTGITYTGNLPYDHGTAAIGHLWTLATEEQFYLVWPILLTLGIRWRRVGILVAGSAMAIMLILTATVFVAAPDVYRIYPFPSSWAIAMVIGAAAKLWEGSLRQLIRATPIARHIAGWAALFALLALTFVREDIDEAWTYYTIGPAVALVTVVLIYIWSAWRDLPSRALAPLLWLGTISYAAYLWNYPIVTWMVWEPAPWLAPIASIVLTILAATVSWWLVEKPVQRWRRRMEGKTAATTVSEHTSSLIA